MTQTSNENQTPWPMIIVIIVVVGFLMNQPPKVAPVPNVPAANVTASVLALRQVAAAGDKVAVAKLSKLYSDFAEVIGRLEPGSLQSSQLRAWLIRSDTYLIRGTNLVGAVPGFGAAKDAIFTEALGLEDRPLTPADIAAAVAACRSIAEACK